MNICLIRLLIICFIIISLSNTVGIYNRLRHFICQGHCDDKTKQIEKENENIDFENEFLIIRNKVYTQYVFFYSLVQLYPISLLLCLLLFEIFCVGYLNSAIMSHYTRRKGNFIVYMIHLDNLKKYSTEKLKRSIE